jgi:HTH-type transcriptional regulator / antitoxin HigA
VADDRDVLGLLISDHEDAIAEHPESTPVERLRHLIEKHSLTQAELARRTAVAVTSLSDILDGRRRISPRIRARSAECFA